ncbi:GGDEF domain-containing response regulator [Alkalilimnicola ehrlichii]|uniref:two-component system response regulator n=1 Tax=Alkalilimnicola ehrlichii TaxID=351052 RepID=UPI0015F26D44|nr:GGDEF domain-containing response regulator [Alkalilimnicola ehrlichii]
MSKLLEMEGFVVTAVASSQEALAALDIRGERFDGVVLEWPLRTDPMTDDLLTYLDSAKQRPLAVVVLSEMADPAQMSWSSRRPRTALVLWQDYMDVARSLRKLIEARFELGSWLDEERRENAVSDIRMLFVDDSPTVRGSYRKLLSRHGYQVDTAASVEEGFELACSGDYDIAIIDYFMPGSTGDELCRRLRENPVTAEMSLAIITGSYLDRVIMDALAAGAVECMFKSEAAALFLARVDAMSRTIHHRRSIEKQRQRLQGILCSVGDGVYGVDNKGAITFMNSAAQRVLGFDTPEQYLGISPRDLFHGSAADGSAIPEGDCLLTAAYARGEHLSGWQTSFWTRSGRAIPVECTVHPLYIGGEREGSVVAFRDVSERKLLEEELRWQANHDALTKLLNRCYLEKALEDRVQRLGQGDTRSALLYIDLDQFKYINDTAGHSAGDRLLIDVGQVLQGRVRATDTLARLGGDEFAIILGDVAEEEAAQVAEEFRRLIASETFVYADKRYNISASIGVALIDESSDSPGEVLANADLACHVAKEKGRNCVHVYEPESDKKRAMDLELGWSSRLHEALEEDRFDLAFHPIVAIKHVIAPTVPGGQWEIPEEQVNHYEVLLRLRGADGQVVMPEAFLPTAERFNLMPAIDRWVLRRAVEELAIQQAAGRSINFSINLSAHTIADPGLANEIVRLLANHGVDPSALCFEITETSAITNLAAARGLIDQLRALGCRFALDDFGSGFCSFGQLKNLAVDFIKIDGLFTKGVVSDPIDRAVVLSIVEIAKASGIRTVAEFVENAEVLRYLSESGVDFVQGNFISEPRNDPHQVAVCA